MSPFPRERKAKPRFVLSSRAGHAALEKLRQIPSKPAATLSSQSAPSSTNTQVNARRNQPYASRPNKLSHQPRKRLPPVNDVVPKIYSAPQTIGNHPPRSGDQIHLFIDGSNLYSAQYTLFGPDEYLDFSRAIKLIEETIGTIFTHIHFYASYNPRGMKQTEQEKKMSKNEFIFYKSAKKDKRVLFFTGYRSPTSGKEKEVDVKLTADMISMALMGEVNSIHLMTGDADFLQALVTIHQYKPEFPVRLICIENRILYKGLYMYPADIIQFTTKPLKIAKKAHVHRIKKDHAALCVAKI
ncbi:MAG: NYN domain-containing protein [Candidatus Roizmanbacteria bacterium]